MRGGEGGSEAGMGTGAMRCGRAVAEYAAPRSYSIPLSISSSEVVALVLTAFRERGTRWLHLMG